MSRPIAETPILYGEDALRFEERMRQVESLTKEERQEIIVNSRKQLPRLKNTSMFEFSNDSSKKSLNSVTHQII